MKNAIITGAGGDIGACIAELAVRLDYRVAAIDVHSKSIDELADRLDNVIPLVADITEPGLLSEAEQSFWAERLERGKPHPPPGPPGPHSWGSPPALWNTL